MTNAWKKPQYKTVFLRQASIDFQRQNARQFFICRAFFAIHFLASI